MPTPAVPSLLAVETLIALFAGCEHTSGHPTGPLAERICQHLRPAGLPDLQHAIYGPDWPASLISNRELHAMRRGFRAWTKAGRPTL